MASSILRGLRNGRDGIGILKPIKVGVATAFFLGIVLLFLPNQYTSEARILPVEGKMPGGLGQLMNAATTLGLGLPVQEQGDSNFVDILRSRSIKEEVLSTPMEFHYRSWRYGKEKFYRGTLLNFFECRNIDRGVKKLTEKISFSKDIKTRIILASAKTSSPEMSEEILKAFLARLEKFLLSKNRTRGSEKVRFTEARLQEAKENVSRSEEAFQRFLASNRNYQLSSDPVVRLQGARMEADLKLRQQLMVTNSLNMEQALLEEKNDIPILNVLDPPNHPFEKSGPNRLVYCVMSFFLAFLGALAWLKRKEILRQFLDEEKEGVLDEVVRPVDPRVPQYSGS